MQPDLEPAIVARLNRASAAKRFYPFDDDVIDWAAPLDDEHLYLPAQLSVFYESGAWERLSLAERSYLTRWELTQMFRNAGLGEHILNQGVLAMLWSHDQYAPSWRFLLHEVAEECQHMVMFNAWVVHNSDFETVGLAQHPLGWRAGRFGQRLARRFPELFWLGVLLFEGVGDDVFRQLAANHDGNIHSIPQQIGRAHVVEEARHIAFALHWLEERVPTLSTRKRRMLHRIADLAFAGLDRYPRLFPIFYSEQIAHLVTQEEFRRGLKSAGALKPFYDHIQDVAKMLERVGAVAPRTAKRVEARRLKNLELAA